ncbi:hypothetical protein PtA15_17A250 [Puccinia triticina]|uniref:Uncharacterized protein n=1 Tax=Puccinia triticina TaxID=208348 RepID=A0ABY7D565_9BASI|nr:uncharacterized protein PtA15_17A250 [Puccinia triticina]WAQ92768.1 hypothetical protein PtA15_17A250 [Puccinia triticina]
MDQFRSQIPPVRKLLLDRAPLDADEFLKSSKDRFLQLCQKIDESVEEGHLIYFDDGEADDQWQSMLGALNGIVPEMIVSRGGYAYVRNELTRRLWDLLLQVAGSGKPKPIFSPIHGATKLEELVTFDKKEGEGEILGLSAADLAKHRASSFDATKLARAIETTKKELRNRLKNNKFTTIVVKCAPTGLAKLIEEANATDKVAIIWTGFMHYDKENELFSPKFNVFRDPEASMALLNLNVPIILPTPRLRNSELTAIRAIDVARVLTNPSFDLVPDQGFARLHELIEPKGLIAKSLTQNQDKFRESRINTYLESKDGLRLEKLKAQKAKGRLGQKEQQDLQDIEKKFAKDQGRIWFEAEEKIRKEKLAGSIIPQDTAPLRDFCPIDHYAHIILKKFFAEKSVKEVLTARIKLFKEGDVYKLSVAASSGSNLYLPTAIDSRYLRDDIEDSIAWLLEGEPLIREKYLEIPPVVNTALREDDEGEKLKAEKARNQQAISTLSPRILGCGGDEKEGVN